jgi:nucleoside 2-deoxyribosyltransferase
MIYIYNAGPLFSEAEIKQRKEEGKALWALKGNHKEFFIANPIDLPFDNTKILTSKEIFNEDAKHVDLANVFFFELASGDTGTMVELGMAIEKFRQGKDIKIYPIFFDLRLPRNQASGVECPVGFNSYLVGSLTSNHIPIHSSFNEAMEAFKRDFNLN